MRTESISDTILKAILEECEDSGIPKILSALIEQMYNDLQMLRVEVNYMRKDIDCQREKISEGPAANPVNPVNPVPEQDWLKQQRRDAELNVKILSATTGG